MISQLLEALRQLFGASLPWVVVPPWCIGVRVRLGKRASRLEPGIHLRIPLLDQVRLVSTRVRYVNGQTVTVAGSRPGTVRVRMALVGFRISDPIAALLRFASLEHVVQSLATLYAGRFPDPIAALEAMRAEVGSHGISVESLEYSEDAEMRALKIIQNSAALWMNGPTPHDAEF